MTAEELIESSLRLIGALAPGETPSGSEGTDALFVLNQMLDSWNAESLSIFTISRSVFDFIANQQAYTYGVGGDFNAARPAKIDHCSVLYLSNPSQPLELPLQMLTDEQWSQIPVKAVYSTIPLQVWDDGGYPLRTLSFWPIPSAANQFCSYAWTALTEFTDLATDNDYPPGYAKALRYNLAVDLAPEWGVELPPVVAAQAVSSKAILKSMNIGPIDIRCDGALVNPKGGYYNYRSDTFGKPI